MGEIFLFNSGDKYQNISGIEDKLRNNTKNRIVLGLILGYRIKPKTILKSKNRLTISMSFIFKYLQAVIAFFVNYNCLGRLLYDVRSLNPKWIVNSLDEVFLKNQFQNHQLKK